MRGTEVFGLLSGVASSATTKMNTVFLEEYRRQTDEMFARFHSETSSGGRDLNAYNDYLKARSMNDSELRDAGLEDSKYIRYEFTKRRELNRFVDYIRDSSNNVPPEVIEKMAVSPVKHNGKWLMEIPATVARRDNDGNVILDARGDTVRFDVMNNVESGYMAKTGQQVEHYNWREDMGDAEHAYTQETASNAVYGTLKAEMLTGMGGLGSFIRSAERISNEITAWGDFDQEHALTANTRHGEHGEDISCRWSGLRGNTKAVKVFDNGTVVMDGKDITNTRLGQRTLELHKERTNLASDALDMSTFRRQFHFSDTNRKMTVNANEISAAAKNQVYASGEEIRGMYGGGVIDRVRNSFGEQAIMLRQEAGFVLLDDRENLMNALTKMQGTDVKNKLTPTQSAFIDKLRANGSDAFSVTYQDKITMVEILDKMTNETRQNPEFLTEAEEKARGIADAKAEDGGMFRMTDEDIKIFGNFGTKRQLDSIRDDLGVDLNFEEHFGEKLTKQQLVHIDPNLVPVLAMAGVTYDETAGTFFDANSNALSRREIRENIRNAKEQMFDNAGLQFNKGGWRKDGVLLTSDEAVVKELTALYLAGGESGDFLLDKGMSYDASTGKFMRKGKELNDKQVREAFEKRFDQIDDTTHDLARDFNEKAKTAGYDINKDTGVFTNMHGADISREDLLKLDKAFLDKASAAGYNFITAANTFDVKALENLNDKDLAKLKEHGISPETVKAMQRLHGNDGNFISQKLKGTGGLGKAKFLGSSAKLGAAGLGKGMSLATGGGLAGKLGSGEGDAEAAQFQSMTNSYKKGIHSVKQTHAYVKQFSDAVQMRVTHAKESGAENVAKDAGNARKKNIKENRAAKRQNNPKSTEKYLASREKATKRVSKSEKRWEKITAVTDKVNVKKQAKKKLANSAVGKALTKALTAVKGFLLKVVGIFLGIYLLIGGAIMAVLLIISLIQALLNLPHDGLKKLYVAAFGEGEPAAVVLYKYMNNELQETWLTGIGDYQEFYDERDGVNYTLTYTDYTNYINSIENIQVIDGKMYINPFHDVGDSVPKDNMTLVECYDGVNETQIMANPSVYGEKQNSSSINYVSTESGHTCNIKDILAMVDVMYCFDINKFGDGEMSNILGEDPAAIDFENFWNKFTGTLKWLGGCIKHAWNSVKSFFGFGDDDDEDEFPKLEDYWGGAVSYGTIQNYCGTLFMTSHQSQVNLDVKFYPMKKLEVNIDGEVQDITDRISQNNASRVGICNSPVHSDFKIAYDGSKLGEDKIYPYLLDDSGNKVDLSRMDNSDLPMGLRMTSEEYGHCTDDDPCLWNSMAEDIETYNKIKDKADDECWKTTEKKDDYTPFTTIGDWKDSEADAKNNAYGKLWDKYQYYLDNPPTVAKEFTLTADHNGFTRIWKEACWHNESCAALENKQVEDGTEMAQMYWTNGAFGGDLSFDDDGGSRHAAYEYTVTFTDNSTASYYGDSESEVEEFYTDHIKIKRGDGTYDEDNYGERGLTASTISCEAIKGERTKYKTIYRATWKGDLIVQHTEIYNRECEGHEFEYCGGHVGCHVKGVVYSTTNEQLALAGMYSDDSLKPIAGNFDMLAMGYDTIRGKVINDEIDYETNAYAASMSGGCKSPLEDIQGSDVNRGLNLYVLDTDGALGDGMEVRTDVSTQTLRDIFDVDCMIDKGKNIFPWKAIKNGGKGYKEYMGWNSDNMTMVALRVTGDWNDLYGFDIPLEIGSVSLSENDIKVISDALAMDYGSNYTDTRKEAVEFILHWISRGHYSDKHTDHDFLDIACKAHSFARTINGVTRNVSYDACCTAANSKSFVNWYLRHFEKNKYDMYHDSENLNFSSPSVLKPADTFYRKADSAYTGGYTDYEMPVDFLPELDETGHPFIEAGETTAGDNITDALCDMRSNDNYGVYIGTLHKIFDDDSYEFPEGIEKVDDTIVLTNGYVLHKDVPITVTLSLQPRENNSYGIKMSYNSGAGTVYLRTEASENYGHTGTKQNWYWFLNPDSRVFYRKFEP